ncbi:MAG: Fic family protein [Methanimicrococcus sp.]|nr:Fic family protein [Methanimicrococcus sp.]
MQTLKQKYQKAEELNEKLISLRPLDKNTLQSLKDYYRVGLTYSSNALEGNSLTESETKIVIEDGLTIDGKPLRDIYEAVGHANAYDYIWQSATHKTLEEDDILRLHKLFYERIDPLQAGVYRSVQVFISGSRYPVASPDKIKTETAQFVSWFNQYEQILHPVEFVASVHKNFVFIHPFIDGNGRVARLLMNLALLRRNYSIALIPVFLRSDYIRLLETAHTDDEPFKEFIAERVIETQKDLLGLFHQTE